MIRQPLQLQSKAGRFGGEPLQGLSKRFHAGSRRPDLVPSSQRRYRLRDTRPGDDLLARRHLVGARQERIHRLVDELFDLGPRIGRFGSHALIVARRSDAPGLTARVPGCMTLASDLGIGARDRCISTWSGCRRALTLCPSCPAEYQPDPGIVVHEDGWPRMTGSAQARLPGTGRGVLRLPGGGAQ